MTDSGIQTARYQRTAGATLRAGVDISGFNCVTPDGVRGIFKARKQSQFESIGECPVESSSL